MAQSPRGHRQPKIHSDAEGGPERIFPTGRHVGYAEFAQPLGATVQNQS